MCAEDAATKCSRCASDLRLVWRKPPAYNCTTLPQTTTAHVQHPSSTPPTLTRWCRPGSPAASPELPAAAMWGQRSAEAGAPAGCSPRCCAAQSAWQHQLPIESGQGKAGNEAAGRKCKRIVGERAASSAFVCGKQPWSCCGAAAWCRTSSPLTNTPTSPFGVSRMPSL